MLIARGARSENKNGRDGNNCDHNYGANDQKPETYHLEQLTAGQAHCDCCFPIPPDAIREFMLSDKAQTDRPTPALNESWISRVLPI
jgi:hypothetical protein